MSLLDDVSIVVTPNGYKAGELYAVIPVPTEGAELVTNGDFATDSDWTKVQSTISNGEATITSPDGSYAGIYQNFLTVGKFYTYNIDVTSVTNGVSIFSGSSLSRLITSSGNYQGSFVASNVRLEIKRNGSDIMSATISNVSVKELTSADMDVTRATAATRVDENGLVNYAQVVSDTQLVDNGTFLTNTSSLWIDWDNLTRPLNSSQQDGYGILDATTGTCDARQDITVEIGKTYLIEATLKQDVGGIGRLYMSDGANYLYAFGSFSATTTETTFKQYVVPTQTVIRLYAYNSGSAKAYYKNLSIKQADLDNVPRIDYTGGGCPHILAEPQRTNLIQYSEDFSQSAWNKYSLTAIDNFATSPSGDTTASKLTEGASASNTQYRTNTSISSTSAIHTISVYVKRLSGNRTAYIDLGLATAFFNFDTESIYSGNGRASFESAGNGWYRIILSHTTAAITQSWMGFGSGNGETYTSGAGGAEILFWGVQTEVGSYPTSYIPTSGSAVTRNQDQFTRDGIGSLINSTEGVLFVEMAALANDGSYRVITISDGTSANYIALYYNPTSNNISWELKVGNAVQFSRNVSLPLGSTSFNKFAFKYKENDCKLFLNGVESDIYTSNVTFTSNTLNSLFLTNGDGILLLFGKVKQLQVYKTALTDNQLIQLTGEAGTHFFESYTEMAEALTYTIQ